MVRKALNDNELEVADEAVRAAGGEWARAAGDEYQLKVKHMRNPDGWATYCLKKASQTRRDLRTDAGLDPTAHVKIIGVTASLKARAKMQHDEVRRAIERL